MAKKGGDNPLDRADRLIREALTLLTRHCPRLVKGCYWAGTSSMSVEELRHRVSLDLDFHTIEALDDVGPILAEIEKAFPRRFETVHGPDEFGSEFRGFLTLARGKRIPVEVRSNFESVPRKDLVPARTAPKILRVSVRRYLADKVQCVAERTEARDLVDLWAVIEKFPELEGQARRLVAAQDAVLLAEKLRSWTAREIAADLKSYPDARASDAARARDLLLSWVKENG